MEGEKVGDKIEGEKVEGDKVKIQETRGDKVEVQRDKDEKVEDGLFVCKNCSYSWKPRKIDAKQPKCPVCRSKRILRPKKIENEYQGEVGDKIQKQEIDVDEKVINELLEDDKPKRIKSWIWAGIAVFVLGLLSLFFFQTAKKPDRNSVSRTQESAPQKQIVYDIHPPGLR